MGCAITHPYPPLYMLGIMVPVMYLNGYNLGTNAPSAYTFHVLVRYDRTNIVPILCLLADSPEWRKRREKYPEFFSDPRNVILLGCADGATVWKDLRGVFPVTFQYLNLHPAIRGKFVNMELFALCNGTKPKSTQPIYELFVDQLLELWKGVPCYDIVTKTSFNLRCMLFKMLFDIKGLMDGACRMDVGAYFACLKCWQKAWYSDIFKMRYSFRTEDAPGEHCLSPSVCCTPTLFYDMRVYPACTYDGCNRTYNVPATCVYLGTLAPITYHVY